MIIKTFLFCGVLVVISHASLIKIKPNIQLKSQSSESSSTSPTISVQRYGGSTFYDYVKLAPTTTVESEALADEEENITEIPSIYSASEAVTSVVSTSTTGDADDDDSNEDAVVLGESEDDVETSETTLGTTLSPTPPAAVQQDDGHTEVPASAADSSGGGGSSSITGDNGGLPDAPGGDSGGVPSAPSSSGDSSDGGNAGGVPSDQTPPPAEAVPGQPGEDDPDSSSSSSEESSSSSSSSSEEFKDAYVKKAWEYKLKSKQQESLARIHSKFMKKDKISKYLY